MVFITFIAMDMNGRVLSTLDIEDFYLIFEKKSDQMKVKAIINSLAIRKASMATNTVYKPKVKISFIRIGFFNFIDIQILRLLNLQYHLLPQ